MSYSVRMPTMDASCTLIVHALSRDTTPDWLANQMARWGQVDRVLLCPDPGYVHPDTMSCLVGPLWALVAYVDSSSAMTALSCCTEANGFKLRRYRSPTDPPLDTDESLLMLPQAAAAAAASGSAHSSLTATLESLRAKCADLQAENQRLANLVYDKDKATRLLLANVEAWKQKLDCVEKCKAQDVQGLQSIAQELDRMGEHLVGDIGNMRAQLDERRAAEMANQASLRRLQELERENTALINILQGKCKDNPPLLQLLASLQTVKQDLRLHETEHTRLTYLLAQREKQCGHVSSRLAEAKSHLERMIWNHSGGDMPVYSQQAAVVRELVIERDRIKAQLIAISVGREQLQNRSLQQQHKLPTPSLPLPSPLLPQQQPVVLVEQPRESQPKQSHPIGVTIFDDNDENCAPTVDKDAFVDKENCANPASGTVTPKAKKPLQPIGSGRRSKLAAKSVNPAAASPALPASTSESSPSTALTAAFNRLTVGGSGSGRAPFGSLQIN